MEGNEKTQKSIQNATLAVALITNFVTPFAVTALNIAVPHIGKEYGASATSLTWIVLSFLMATALLSIPFGRFADIHGRKAVLKTGILFFCVFSFLNIFSLNMPMFLLFRVLQGIGGAMIFATNIAILVDVFPAAKRGSVLGISVAAVYAGSAVGPVAGGLITQSFGWRGVFVVISILALIAFVTAMARSPRESKAEVIQKLNSSSVVLYLLSFGMFLYGIVTLMQNIWSYIILTAGFIIVILFIKHEARSEAPVLEVRLFRKNRIFVLSILAAVFNYASIFAVAYLMSIYLQLARGMSADLSGLIMIFQPIVQASLSPIAGKLSDKKPPAAIASTGMACCAGALLMFAFLDLGTPVPYIIAGFLLTGLGISFFTSPNSNVIYGSVSNRDYGVATSLVSTSRNFGQVIGMALLTIIIHAVIGNVPIAEVAPEAIVRNMQISFLVFSAICFAGIVISLQRRK